MNISRRSAMTMMAGAAAGAALPAWAEDKDKTLSTKPVRNPIAVSTYSFWRFRRGERATMEECIDLAAEMGFDAVELLEVQMRRKDDAYLQQLKRRAFVSERVQNLDYGVSALHGKSNVFRLASPLVRRSYLCGSPGAR